MNEKLTQRILQAVTAFRRWLPTVPQQFRGFIASVREDPMVLLRSPTVRVAGLAGGGLVLVLFVSCLGDWIAPPGQTGTPAKVVSFRVRCLNPACKFSGSVFLDREFRKWPTECPKCRQKTLHPFVLCYNSKCRKWVVPKPQPDGSLRCPECGAPL